MPDLVTWVFVLVGAWVVVGLAWSPRRLFSRSAPNLLPSVRVLSRFVWPMLAFDVWMDFVEFACAWERLKSRPPSWLLPLRLRDDHRQCAQHVAGVGAGRHRETQHSMLVARRYLGEGEHAVASLLVSFADDQRPVRGFQLGGADVVEVHGELVNVACWRHGSQDKPRVANPVCPRSEVPVQDDRLHLPIFSGDGERAQCRDLFGVNEVRALPRQGRLATWPGQGVGRGRSHEVWKAAFRKIVSQISPGTTCRSTNGAVGVTSARYRRTGCDLPVRLSLVLVVIRWFCRSFVPALYPSILAGRTRWPIDWLRPDSAWDHGLRYATQEGLQMSSDDAPMLIEEQVESVFADYYKTIALLREFMSKRQHALELGILACARLDSLANLAITGKGDQRQRFARFVEMYSDKKATLQGIAIPNMYSYFARMRWMLEGIIEAPGRVTLFDKDNDYPFLRFLAKSELPITVDAVEVFLGWLTSSLQKRYRTTATQSRSKPCFDGQGALMGYLRSQVPSRRTEAFLRAIAALDEIIPEYAVSSIFYKDFRSGLIHEFEFSVSDRDFFSEPGIYWTTIRHFSDGCRYLDIQFSAMWFVDVLEACVRNYVRYLRATKKLPPSIFFLLFPSSDDFDFVKYLNFLDDDAIAPTRPIGLQLGR